MRDQRDKRDGRDLRDPAKNPGLGPGPGRKIRKSGIRDRDSKLKNPGSGTGTGTQIRGTRDSGTQLWGTVPGTKEIRDAVSGTENFPGHGPGPVPTLVYTFFSTRGVPLQEKYSADGVFTGQPSLIG